MLELYSTYDRCQTLRTEVTGPTFDVPSRSGFSGAKRAPYLDVSSRLRADGKTVELFVVNRHLEEDIEATVRFRGKAVTGPIEAATLNAKGMTEWNSFQDRNRVKLATAHVETSKDRLPFRFPAHSLTRLTGRLQ